MREILFRGKRIDNDEWVYGSFCMDAVEQKNGLCGVDGFIRLYDFDKGKMQMHEVDRETIGQFTGLTDKNGKKIFEGDIVQGYKTEFTPPKKYRKPFVATMKTSLPNSVEEYYSPFEHFTEKVKWEIIGNIHDNPELLENP